MKIYDISLPISMDLPVWPGDPPISLALVNSIMKGDQCNVSRLEMGVHSGTHIDAPNHFIRDGATTDSISLDVLMGPCVVAECGGTGLIGKGDLLGVDFSKFSRILLKTGNSELWAAQSPFNENFVALGIDAAQYLVDMNVSLVGIDYLSVEAFRSDDKAVHTVLLSHGVTILEGLDLSGVTQGIYELVCLPLRLRGCEGAPARAILREI